MFNAMMVFSLSILVDGDQIIYDDDHRYGCPYDKPVSEHHCDIDSRLLCSYDVIRCCGFLVATMEAQCRYNHWKVSHFHLQGCNQCLGTEGGICGHLIGDCQIGLVCTTDTTEVSNNFGQCVLPTSQSICERLRYEAELLPCTVNKCYIPQCESNGAFANTQCFDGLCWCVNNFGDEIYGTKTRSDRNLNNCPVHLCPEECDLTANVICGTDGNTYLNECELSSMACHNPKLHLSVACHKACPCT